ncbi:hypothetical protein [uncultured Nostoc sp.]|uniref:hypothetical protein n=1 Tax=uncultured Nostoc sp. TaxID=340711 RepID=UPI00261D07CD|nr:hypothetical protein [uncultured Nostoc sp.]
MELFDDTVYFLSFNNEQVAYKTFKLLTSLLARSFYSSLIFWDEKRSAVLTIIHRPKMRGFNEYTPRTKTVIPSLPYGMLCVGVARRRHRNQQLSSK